MSVSIWAVDPDDPNTGVIWNGSGNPNSAPDFGNYGDFYIDLATYNIYGPKSSTGWGTGVALKGPQGIAGAPGSIGPQGPAGPQGPKGDKGNTGATGAAGAAGTPGTPGSKILTGTVDPDNGDGNTGDFYVNTANGDLWGPKDAVTFWGAAPVGNITGPTPSVYIVHFATIAATNNTTAIVKTAAVDPTLNTNSDYTQVTGIWQSPPYGAVNGITQNAASLTINKTATYKVDFWGSLTSSVNNTNVAFKFAVNGVIAVSRKPWARVGTTGDRISLSGSGLHTLNAGDVVTLWMASDTSANITINDALFALHELGYSTSP